MVAKPQGTVEYGLTMWNDTKSMNAAMKVANMLAKSQFLLPEQYIGHPENCLIAIDIANRMRISPLLVAQNLYVIKQKPAWSGLVCNFCNKQLWKVYTHLNLFILKWWWRLLCTSHKTF